MRNNTLPGGLSLFSMDFTYNGLSWAENICQKLEKICTDNAIVQNPGKYIDAVGEHFRKVFDDVTGDWLNPSDGCGEDPVVDLSLEHGLFSEVCEKSRVASTEIPLNENQLSCIELESIVSSVEDSNSATASNISQESSHTCDEHSEKLIPVSAEVMPSNCPDAMVESSKDVPDSVASLVDLASPLLSADEVPSSESDQNKVMGRELVLSGCAPLQEIYGVTESSDSFHREMTLHIPNADDQNVEFIEEFEDVRVEDCWDNTVNAEVAFITKQACRNKSYKKKLKDAIISKVRTRKGYKQVGKSYDDTDSRLHGGQSVADSSASCDVLRSTTMSANESCDFDWEFL